MTKLYVNKAASAPTSYFS